MRTKIEPQTAMGSTSTVHLSGYQARDYEVVDYHMYELPGSGLKFRGPPLESYDKGSYFTCIGAAQTLGCFCEDPYPKLLEKELGLPALNLGYGGAGPEFFNSQQALIDYMNKGKFVVIQAMSGRSQSNSLFDCDGLELLTRRSDGKKLGANEAYEKMVAGNPTLASLPPKRLFRPLARILASSRTKSVVAETRRNWLRNQLELIEKITVPTVFLWISKRTPEYPEGFKTVNGFFSEFPQMINRPLVDEVAKKVDHYAEVVSSRGSPQPLFSRFTGEATTVDPANDRKDLGKGKPWTHNGYYPSPEMQEDAAEKLLPICKGLV